jgi:hypothetical protein
VPPAAVLPDHRVAVADQPRRQLLARQRYRVRRGAFAPRRARLVVGCPLEDHRPRASVGGRNPDGSFTVSTPATKQVDPFSVLFSGSLPPNGTVNVGFEVIPPATAQRILSIAGYQAGQRMSAEVLAQVTIRGDLGGDEVTATPFYFPISVCTDCVVNVVGPCPAAGTQTGNACNVFQDGVVDCCTSGNQLVCPTQAM